MNPRAGPQTSQSRSRFTAAVAGLLALAGGCGDDGGGGAIDSGVLPTCPPVETAVANEPWRHVDENSDVSYGHNPPTSGAHYPVWAGYQAYDSVVPRGYWVHNLEHGAIVLAHRPDAPAEIVAQLQAVYAEIPDDPDCGHSRSLLLIDEPLDDVVAVVAADVVLEGNCVDRDLILAFVDAHRNQAPEDVCAPGGF